MPYRGNPLAVVLDGTGLSDEDMLQFAQWTHLSETTFLLPPSPEGQAGGADYRVRIFTPNEELPFAGHPTLGSCHAWLQAGGIPKTGQEIVQECAKGLIRIRREGPHLAFAAPSLQRRAPEATLLAAVTAALGLQPHQILAAQQLNNGPVWLGLLLDSPETVLQLTPDHQALKLTGHMVGVVGVERPPTSGHLIARSNREARAFGANSTPRPEALLEAAHIEVRAFTAPDGIEEDPVTGSLNASLAQWLIAEGHLPSRYVASQGACLNRNGQVHISQDASGQVWVGGDSVTCIEGQVRL